MSETTQTEAPKVDLEAISPELRQVLEFDQGTRRDVPDGHLYSRSL